MITEPVWESITIAKALSLCDFDALYVAMNLAFACSLRIGEILGLTWDDIHFTENANDASWLQVSKTLLEVYKLAAAATESRDILMVFPSAKSNSSMSLILKKPKTKHSIRKVYLPRTTADILKEWHIRQLELIDLLGADYISDSQVEKVFKLARCAFNQAVRWNVIPQNPFNQANLCKAKCREREIWDAETIRKALDACRDANLYVCMNLSFACSLRIGEILGLTWNNVHISEPEIKDDDAWLYIMQELARVKRSALAALNNKNIYHIFPAWTGKTTSTVLVLKKPKTDSSIRRVWISKTVAYVLQELRKNQLHQIEMAGCDYTDYNLVIAFPNGHPCEEKRINQAFAKLKAEAKLPDVVFHSLRHSSATYKLKLNHGDLKATQGDTGHAEIDMLTKVYAHILDADRKITAQRFEEAFYQPQDLPEQKDNSPSSPDITALIAQIQQYPELGKILSDVLAKQASTDENTENGNGNLSDSE